MTEYIKKEDAKERTNQLYHGDEVEAWLESLPTIEVSEDCISRSALISFIDAGHLRNPNEKCYNENDVVELIKNAPSVVPKKRTGKPDFADCEKCSKTYGTLGCCSTVSNEWVYSCLEGMTDYAYTRGYKDGAEQSRATGKW